MMTQALSTPVELGEASEPSSTVGRGIASCTNWHIEWPRLAWWAWLTEWHSPVPVRRRRSRLWSAPGSNTIRQLRGCGHPSPPHLASSAVPGKRLSCCWFGLVSLQIALKNGMEEGKRKIQTFPIISRKVYFMSFKHCYRIFSQRSTALSSCICSSSTCSSPCDLKQVALPHLCLPLPIGKCECLPLGFLKEECEEANPTFPLSLSQS